MIPDNPFRIVLCPSSLFSTHITDRKLVNNSIGILINVSKLIGRLFKFITNKKQNSVRNIFVMTAFKIELMDTLAEPLDFSSVLKHNSYLS